MENVISVLYSFTQKINGESTPRELELTRKRIQKGLELLELMVEKNTVVAGSKMEECKHIFSPTRQEVLAEVELMFTHEDGEVDGGIVGEGHHNPLEFATVSEELANALVGTKRELVWWVNIDEDRSRIETCFSLLPSRRLPSPQDFKVYLSSSNKNDVRIVCDGQDIMRDCETTEFVDRFVKMCKRSQKGRFLVLE
ncbi:hypothetical protein LAU_0162 [Lausannevirus]|uniref:Uncharacterized protein n=2 Tax=Lausannevirus TaxID=999883 RepID=A0A0N9PW65_9VIRU|nr:hypothetical protein LAU_0162 [Lausannevirus]AEA07013.1 hypothetical protein LAU_0162 [Lausannevirus]ALH06839.1 hypothetical protein PMV_141 [Port-miou virus]